MIVSVVVPTYRRDDLLSRCLAALMTQDFDPSAYEIIIVDDAASGQTKALVERWAEQAFVYGFLTGKQLAGAYRGIDGDQSLEAVAPRGELVPIVGIPKLRYLPMIGAHGPAAARNAGWKAAAGRIIAFTDDDCIPSSDWLKLGVHAFQGQVAGVSGRVIVPVPVAPTDYERDAGGLERSIFITANCFYRRDALKSIGGFDEKFRMAWREDTDVYYSMVENGYAVRECPDAIVVHPIRPAPFGVSLRQQKKSKYNALLYKKHPTLYREHIQAVPPVRYYGIVLALLATWLGLVLHATRIPLITGAVWIGLTLDFCLERLRLSLLSPRHIFEMVFTSVLIPPLSIYWRIKGAIQFRVWFF